MENTIKNTSPQKAMATAELLPYFALTATVVFWGASFPASRVAVQLLHPQAVMFCRMVIACLIMAPFMHRLKPATLDRRDLKQIIPMVLFQPCLYFLLESNALKLTTSSQAGVISASVPVLVALGAWVFFSEKINGKIILGLTTSVAGVTVLTLCGNSGLSGEDPILGNSMEFAAMVCAAGNMLLVKGLSRKYSPWTLTAMQFATGLVFFSPGIRHIIDTPQVMCRPDLIGALILLGVFASVGAFGLYNWSISRMPATRASVFINLVPAVAVFLGWTLLGETLGPGQIAGALIVGAGVCISQKA
ncbi:MAG: DMT family transporter [Desulfobacter sp.]|nr:MAG: DMT family transporter [Desulfobacter sp.]